jgi:hypothetical protein
LFNIYESRIILLKNKKTKKFVDFIANIYGGYCKNIARNECDFTFETLEKIVPQTISNVPITIIRKFARKCYRYMHACLLGLSPKQAEYAVKKYSSHRRLPANYLKEIPSDESKDCAVKASSIEQIKELSGKFIPPKKSLSGIVEKSEADGKREGDPFIILNDSYKSDWEVALM